MALTRAINRAVTGFLRAGVWAYRLTLGPFLGGHCRFVPTCSQYALDAVEARGPWVGAWLGLRRICRCHPLGGPGGFDPAPAAPEHR